MSVRVYIRKVRELNDLNQETVAEMLGMSAVAYGKIERDETDVSISRLEDIARILEIDYKTILSFDEKYILNITHNQNANGIVHNQQILNDDTLKELVHNLIEESKSMRIFINKIVDKL